MSSVKIFYFSGTGNSYAIAKKLASILGDTELVAIAALSKTDTIPVSSKQIGIVFPVYNQTAPAIIRDFIARMDVQGSPYIFSIATCNMQPGSTNRVIQGILAAKGLSLSAGFVIPMPGNNVNIIDYTNPIEERDRRLAESEHRVREVAKIVEKMKGNNIEGAFQIRYRIKGMISRFIINTFPVYRRFWVMETCSSCKTCLRVCPMQNIIVEGKTVRWGGQCIQCLACLHWCPKRAIQIGNTTMNRLRYHHPEVNVENMYLR